METLTKTNLTGSLRISIRISSTVTSLSIKKNLIALWILLSEEDPKQTKDLITEFVYTCLDKWDKETAKGFSDFVSEKLIQNMLEKEDYRDYRRILKTI